MNEPAGTTSELPRRLFLRGAGAAMALPFLEAMLPSSLILGRALAAPAPARRSGPPLRAAFFYVPNGINMSSWTPPAPGKFPRELPAILKPLEEFRKDLLLISGLAQDKAHAHGDGPGDHARAAAAFLTGAHPLKTGGKDIRVGISVDQAAAERIGHLTPFPSLELGTENGQQSGSCDSGYSCAYSNNISWKTESMPMAKETYPRQLFERLFPNIAGKESAADLKYRKSVIDFILEDARKLRQKLGTGDNRKLDEYLSAIREIEQRIARIEKESRKQVISRELSRFAEKLPDSRSEDRGERIRVMGDLLALAFQADLTRIATFMFANEGSNHSYKEINVPDGHHDVSHHGGKEDKKAKVEKINIYHVEQFAYILRKLKSMKEGGRSLLDSCMILYGSGISDGNSHNHNMLPVLLAGQACGTISTGRHVRYADKTPLNNLYISMLERLGVPCDKLGDSKAPLPDLS